MFPLEHRLAGIPAGEETLAIGKAVGVPVVVTVERIVRAGHDAAVPIPLDTVRTCEMWMDAHRWSIRLFHEDIDPRVAPCGAHQWWRWHDRRAYRRRIERLRHETVLDFSREHTHAADAITKRLHELKIGCRTVDPPARRRSGSGPQLLVSRGETFVNETERATFPNFKGKHAEESMITPQDFLAYARDQGLRDATVPPSVIMCYSPSLSRYIASVPGARQVTSPTAGTFHVLGETNDQVAVVAGFGIGAPAAAMVLEELIAFGATRFVSVGAAGALQRGVQPGDAMLCTSAIRDEGVSHHYAESASRAYPSDKLTQRLRGALVEAGIAFREGATWTIDAPYRETVAEARHYQREGVLAVEMEASALFTVGAVRHVDVAAAFIASDSLAEMTWTPSFNAPEVGEAKRALFAAAVSALLGA